MQNKKKFLSIFLPCSITVGVSALVLPMVCLSTKDKHVVRASSEKNKYFKVKDLKVRTEVDITYTFQTIDENFDAENLNVNWDHSLTSNKKCKLKIKSKIYNLQTKELLVTFTFSRNDDGEIIPGDFISFDIFFEYKDEKQKSFWSCFFANNYIKAS